MGQETQVGEIMATLKQIEDIVRKVMQEFLLPLPSAGMPTTGPFPHTPPPVVVPPEPIPSGTRLPNGLWPYVTYTMLAGMPLYEMSQYTNLTPQQVHVWAQDKEACEIPYPAPNYLFR
jgi:hypothetical protein